MEMCLWRPPSQTKPAVFEIHKNKITVKKRRDELIFLEIKNFWSCQCSIRVPIIKFVIPQPLLTILFIPSSPKPKPPLLPLKSPKELYFQSWNCSSIDCHQAGISFVIFNCPEAEQQGRTRSWGQRRCIPAMNNLKSLARNKLNNKNPKYQYQQHNMTMGSTMSSNNEHEHTETKEDDEMNQNQNGQDADRGCSLSRPHSSSSLILLELSQVVDEVNAAATEGTEQDKDGEILGHGDIQMQMQIQSFKEFEPSSSSLLYQGQGQIQIDEEEQPSNLSTAKEEDIHSDGDDDDNYQNNNNIQGLFIHEGLEPVSSAEDYADIEDEFGQLNFGHDHTYSNELSNGGGDQDQGERRVRFRNDDDDELFQQYQHQ
jgi:hypothetical protein